MADLGKGRGAWTRAAQAEGDTLYRAAWFDGQRPSVLNMEENTYTAPTEPGPKRFPRVSQIVAEFIHAVFYLADMVRPISYSALADLLPG